MWGIGLLQLGFGFALLLLVPGADRLENHAIALQFVLEGAQTFVLVFAGLGGEERASAQAAAFALGVAAVFMPFVLKAYDFVLTVGGGLWRAARKDGGCSPMAALFASWALLMTAAPVVTSLLGLELSGTAAEVQSTAAESGEQAGDTAEMLRDQSALVDALEDGLGAAAGQGGNMLGRVADGLRRLAPDPSGSMGRLGALFSGRASGSASASEGPPSGRSEASAEA